MTSMQKLAVASILVLSGCAMEFGEDVDPADTESIGAESSVNDPAELGPGEPDPGADVSTLANCFYTWICTKCPGVPYRRDVLWEECDDGTRRVVDQTACGERDCN